MQVTGTTLTVVFALAIVVLTRSTSTLSGLPVLLGSAILVAVSLGELATYQALSTGNPATVRVAADFIPGVQLGYSLVAAPILFGALGYLLLCTRALPPVFGYSALLFGLVFWVCGLVTVIRSIQGFIDVWSGVQSLWWMGAGVFVAVRGLRETSVAGT